MTEIASEGDRFRVKVDGPDDAPVILMSHSLGCDLTMWDDVVPALAQSYRVVRYDTRGHGESVVVDRPTSIAELADDALAILDALGVERAHFVGLSMGGMIGQWLLRHAPDRLDRVVLCNTSARLGPPQMWNERIRTARKDGMRALLDATMQRWFTPEFRAQNNEGLARIAKMYETTSPLGFASCCAAIRDMDQRWPLHDAIGDVTVLVGARDPGTTPEMGALIAAAIPGARLVSVDTAHISVVERPDQVAAAILAALAAPPRKAPRKAPRKSAPPARPARVAARARAAVPRRAPAALGKPAPGKSDASPKPGATTARASAGKRLSKAPVAAAPPAPKPTLKRTPVAKTPTTAVAAPQAPASPKLSSKAAVKAPTAKARKPKAGGADDAPAAVKTSAKPAAKTMDKTSGKIAAKPPVAASKPNGAPRPAPTKGAPAPRGKK